MATLRQLEAHGLSVSRLEESHPAGWLGRQGDPAELPARAWFDGRDPTDDEERQECASQQLRNTIA